MEFQKRLEKAIERGRRAQDERERQALHDAATLEELKRLHAQYRLALSEHIERCLKQLPQHFPGFEFDTLVSDLGWGAKVTRDDFGPADTSRRTSYFSRLEMAVRPFSEARVVDLVAKGTVRNKEIFNRQHYQRIEQFDETSFDELVDLWVLEFAELYARSQ